MKQILFACGGHDFPKGAFEFLKSLHNSEQLSVTGLFFSPIDYEYRIPVSHISINEPFRRLKETEPTSMDLNKAFFAEQCTSNHIKYQIHDNDGEWDKALFTNQSRFADLVVLSRELFYADSNIDDPDSYLHKALRLSECPVIMVPESFTPFEHLVVAYDGGKESLFALKQLCYLFPYFTDLPTEIVYVNQEDSDEVPDIAMLSEYCRLHFESLNFAKLRFRTGQFSAWVAGKKNALLVSGSFGRSSFSYAKRSSFMEDITRDLHIPVFNAHSI
jgi:hypothetical protein